MGFLKGDLVKFVAGNLEPAINEIIEKLDGINNNEKLGFEVESFSITSKGVIKLPEISLNFRKKK